MAIYGDLPGYFHPNALFRSMRPDIVLTKNGHKMFQE